MTPAETRRAAKVMIDSLKKGAVVVSQYMYDAPWIDEPDPAWDWINYDYRVRAIPHRIRPKTKKKRGKG